MTTYKQELINEIENKMNNSQYDWDPDDRAKEWLEDNITIYTGEDILFAGFIVDQPDPFIWFIQMPTDDSKIWYCTVDAADIYHDEEDDNYDDVVERLGLDDLDRLDYMFLKI